MEDTPVQFSSQQQAEGGTSAAASAKADEGGKYLTAAELEAILDRRDLARDRQQQGLRKKMEDRIVKRMTTMRQAKQEAGEEITPRFEQAARQKAEREVIEEMEQEIEQPSAKTQPDKPVQPVQQSGKDAELEELWQEHGIKVMASDPEAASIDKSSRWKFLKSYEAALVAKKARLAQQQADASRGRIATGGSGTVTGGITSEDDYRTKVKAAAGNRTKILEIQEQARKSGLDPSQIPLYPRSS